MKRAVLAFSFLLLGGWVARNYHTVIAHDDDGLIRFVLGTLFALIVLVRSKPRMRAPRPPSRLYVIGGVVGMLLVVLGLVFRIHQFEWVGLLTICGTCMMWALPPRNARDVAIALFIFYWIHPIPTQIFGSMRLLMQALSVRGAEWLLHSLNIAAWADELVLYVGSRPVGVPEACSGMRTAVTVLLCTLGVTILLRFRWWHAIPFLILGLLQVLLFNVLRIAIFAYFVQRMPPEWGNTFLHDTLGIFLLITLLIVQLEASWWKYWTARRGRIKEGIKSGELEKPDRGTILPRFFQTMGRWGWIPLLVAIVAAALAVGIYKRRPAHRSAMVARAVEELVDSHPDKAERAIRTALALAPDNRELMTKLAHALVKREKFEDALKVCEEMTPPLSTFDVILKSWCLMALDRPEEAVAAVESLPPSKHNLPGVAIIRAEYAARQDEPDVVSRNVAIANRTHVFANRIRALFSYLAAREQWQAIVDSDNHVAPYTEIGHAVLAIHANLRLNVNNGAARAMENALTVWPDDSRFLDQIYELALRLPAGKWEISFARVLERNLAHFNSKDLALYMDNSFRLTRPDLAWQVYAELHRRDPNDPTLLLAVARYARNWFVFRKHHLGLAAKNKFSVVDVLPYVNQLRHMAPLQGLAHRIPLADEFLGDNRELIRSRYLNACLSELDRREKAGELTENQELIYPTALALALRFDEAHSRLDALAVKYPEQKRKMLLRHAIYYNEEERWGEVYEALRRYRAIESLAVLQAEMMMTNAAMNLGMGIFALQTVERSLKIFPGTTRVSLAESALWNYFQHSEEALHILERASLDNDSRIVAQLLYDTGRFRAADQMAKTAGAQVLQRPLAGSERVHLAPLEHVAAVIFPPPLTREEMAAEAETLERPRENVKNVPFLKSFNALLAKWYRSGAPASGFGPDAWEATGRDEAEKATALHLFSIFAARQEQEDLAAQCVARAVKYMPTSPVLRRLHVAFQNADPTVVRNAAAACPDDSEVWLALLLTGIREGKPEYWFEDSVGEAIKGQKYCIEAVVRAGDFLMRRGFIKPAVMAARHAQEHARGLLPAHMLALQCALRLGDAEWALASALQGADTAVDPAVFYKTIIALKSRQRTRDVDLLTALEYLRRHMPREHIWTERLGFEYFHKGENKRALNLLSSVLQSDLRSLRVHSLIAAAEAARVEGFASQSIEILKAARILHPDNMAVLNNLIYYLAQSDATLPEARKLLPKLLAFESDSFSVYDTVAMVYLKSDDVAKARELMDKAIATLDQDDYSALEIRLNAARVLLRGGDLAGAKNRVDNVRKNVACPAHLEAEIRELLLEISRRREAERQR